LYNKENFLMCCLLRQSKICRTESS